MSQASERGSRSPAPWARPLAICLALALVGVISVAAVVAGVTGWAAARSDHLIVITSGSMEPSISPGDAILVDPVDVGRIRVGDVITFGNSAGTLTTHRVVGLPAVGDVVHFQTQGDANPVVDPDLVHPGAVVGRVDSTLPDMGRLLHFVSTPTGRMLLIVIPILLIAMREIREIRRTMRGGVASAGVGG